ncbi:hypothetical protein D3C85_1774060 [compost metagenome]
MRIVQAVHRTGQQVYSLFAVSFGVWLQSLLFGYPLVVSPVIEPAPAQWQSELAVELPAEPQYEPAPEHAR